MTEALLLVAHGSADHPEPSRSIESLAEEVRRRERFPEVATAYLDDEPHVSTALDAVDADAAVAVPVFTSEGHYVDTVLPRELPRNAELTEPVGTHPSFTYVIQRRALAAADAHDLTPASTALVVVGHGTRRHSASGDSVYGHVERLRRRTRYTETRAAFLDERPRVADVAEAVDADAAVFVPFFVADGPHATEDVPRALGFTELPVEAPASTRVDEVDVVYTGAVVGTPDAADVVVERALDVDASTEAVADA